MNLRVYVKRYLAQTKPRILILLTFTGIIGYMIPSLNDVDPIQLFLFTLFGVFAAAGGLTINNVIDRDIDIQMERTSGRPSVGPDAIPSRNLMIFGIMLSLIGFIGGYTLFGFYTFFYLAFGNLFYLFGYSLYLKRNSILNTIVGGLASPAPVWAAYAARFELGSITPAWTFLGVDLQGWLLGGLVFIWTPSHTWAMATKNFSDYEHTNIPMLPVVIGIPKTAILTFIMGFVTIVYGTWVAFLISGRSLVLLALVLPNLGFIWYMYKFYADPSPETGKNCFKAHNYWLSLVFTVILLFIWTK